MWNDDLDIEAETIYEEGDTVRTIKPEYYGAAEPPVRRRQSHGSGRSEPAVLCRERLFT